MVTAVILSYNRCDEALFTVAKLREISAELPFPLEVIVIDNASTDGTYQQISLLHPEVTLIRIAENCGIAGWNLGFEQAKYPYILVLDDDSHLVSGLPNAISYLDLHPEIGILALNITKGSFSTCEWIDLSETIGFIGCGAIIKKAVYREIGGYATWIGAYAHEWEYGIRCIDAGHKIVYFEHCEVVHRSKNSNENPRARIYAIRNEMATVYIHYRHHRLFNVFRVWLNSMREIKKIGILALYCAFMGGLRFLKLKGSLSPAPVSTATQVFFEQRFWGTQPLFKRARNNKQSELLQQNKFLAGTESPLGVSIVILAYNRCAEVLYTLRELQKVCATIHLPHEVIVVDNASQDDTSAQVSKNFPSVMLIRKPINTGISGWNAGFAKAKFSYFLVLDDDSCIVSGLSEAITYLEQHRDVGILALDIVDEQFKGDPLLDADAAWKHGHDIAGFIGCGAMIRKTLYEQIGGFSEWIHVYTHEFDYTIRCLDAGFRARFFEKAKVVHRVSKLNRSKKMLRIFAARNEMAIVYRHFGNRRLMYIIRIFLNNLKFMKREGWRSGWYVVLGLIEFFKLKNKLGNVPVSRNAQDFYAANFWATQPVFPRHKKKIVSAVKNG